MRSSLRVGRGALWGAALGFLVANLVHGLDHVRQDLAGLDAVSMVIGGALTLAAVAVVLAVRSDRPDAPLLAASVGIGAAVLVAAGHISPEWGPLGRASYPDVIRPDALAWAVMLAEVAAAGALGAVGLRAMRTRVRAGEERSHV